MNVCQAVFSYLNISRVPLAVPPRAADAGEGSLRVVELIFIGVEEKRGEGLLQAREQTTASQNRNRAFGMCPNGC